METPRVIAIRRDNLFSPNHIGNDRLIFDGVITELITAGFKIAVYHEDEFLAITQPIEVDQIITMARNKTLVAKLQAYERSGVHVINSAYGIENCYRTNMVNGLMAAGIPHPKSYQVSTEEHTDAYFNDFDGKGVWVKRGDFHAIHREDVSFAATLDEYRHIVNEYALRGIESAVVCEHLLGDLVKFYGVRETDFFYWFYPYDLRHQKFNDYEKYNGVTRHHPFDEDLLKATAVKASEALGVHIYGGDAIVGKDGRFQIIDLNDWPSFAPCRADAAYAISSFISNALMSSTFLSKKHVVPHGENQ